MKRFLRPTGQILTTAVFTSASLNVGYLTARADETQSQPEATASVVETAPSIPQASASPAPTEAPAVAPPETLPVQSASAPSASVVVPTVAPKPTKEAPAANYVVPTEPAISADTTPISGPSATVTETHSPADEAAGTATETPIADAPDGNAAPEGPANPTDTATDTVAQPTAGAGAISVGEAPGTPSATATEVGTSSFTSATSQNPAKAAKQSFVIESLAAAARRQAQAGNFQQAYLIAQDPLLPGDVQTALLAEIRQLEAIAQSATASAQAATPSSTANPGTAANLVTGTTPGDRMTVAGNQADQPAATVDAIAETMIASARRQAEAGEFQQAYLIAQDPLLSFDIQSRLQSEIHQLEVEQQSGTAAGELDAATEGSSTISTRDRSATEATESANRGGTEERETAIAETLIVAAQQQAQNGNFAQAYLIAQDPFLPVELQSALQADIQQLEAEAQAASSESTAETTAENPAAIAETTTTTETTSEVDSATDSASASLDDKRPLKQQAIVQNLMRIALDYAAAGDVDAANLIAQDPSLSAEQQQELQRQLADLLAQSENAVASASDGSSEMTTAEQMKLDKIELVAEESATDEATAATAESTEGQTALVPSGSFETFGLNQLNVGSSRGVNGPLSPLPSLAYLNSAYSAAFSCAQPAANQSSDANPAAAPQATANQANSDTAKSVATRDASAPIDLSFLDRNGFAQADFGLAADSRFSVPQAAYTAPTTLLEADQQPFQYYVTDNTSLDPILSLKQFGWAAIGVANPSGNLRYVASDLGKTAIANLNIFDKIVAITHPNAEQADIAQANTSPAAAAAKALPAPPAGGPDGLGQLVSNRSAAFETFNPNNLAPKNTNCYPIVTSAVGGQVLATPIFGAANFQFPLSVPAPITSPVGWRIHPISGQQRFHAGTDFGAPTGTPVVAAKSGQVAIADYVGGYGATVVIDHADDNQQTLYAHLSQILVPSGMWVEAGTVIGLVGNTGNSTGPHLHFEVRQLTNRGWVAVNPIR